MKNNLFPAVENIPRFCDHRGRLEILVELRKPDHQIGNDVERDVIRRWRPVETGRLGAEIHAEANVARLRSASAADQNDCDSERKKPSGGWEFLQSGQRSICLACTDVSRY